MKPILFNTAMTRAILEGRKMVTRRIVKPQPVYRNGFWELGGAGWSDGIHKITPVSCHTLYNRAPYHPGDILYVRETFCEFNADHIIDGCKYAYKADATAESERPRKDFGYKWTPSIHMPREAARIFLRVKSVTVERLQEITGEQCAAEGLGREPLDDGMGEDFMRGMFEDVWNSTIKPADRALYGWEASPWVWVIEFGRISEEQ